MGRIFRSFVIIFIFAFLSLKAKPNTITIHDFIRKNLNRTNIEVGCWLQKNFGFIDKHCNCNTKKSSLNEDGSCLDGGKTKYGPQIPKANLKRFNISIDEMALSYLNGRLNKIDLTVSQPTDEEVLTHRLTHGKESIGIVPGKQVAVTMFKCKGESQCVTVALQLPWSAPKDDDCKVD